MSVNPFGATYIYLDGLNKRQQMLSDFKKYGWGGEILDQLEHPENDEGLQKAKRAAEREQADMAEFLTPKPVTITGQMPASIIDALVKGTAESARLGERLQRMLGHVADLNNALKTTTPEAYAELLQDMDQAHADEYMGGRRQELQRLRADPVESIGDRLVNLGFSVSGQLF
ncbi:MAG TPA: hypothetical protein VK196_07970, partial [Magnetospirillum sp.]|nr:hypothetical protein [Magnetospirillum sp.]